LEGLVKAGRAGETDADWTQKWIMFQFRELYRGAKAVHHGLEVKLGARGEREEIRSGEPHLEINYVVQWLFAFWVA